VVPWLQDLRDEVTLLFRETSEDDYTTPGGIAQHHDGVSIKDKRLAQELRAQRDTRGLLIVTQSNSNL